MKVLLAVDRDGTLIEDVSFLGKNPNWKEEIIFKENVLDLILEFQKKHVCKTFIITNQAGVARGYFTEETLREINLFVEGYLKKRGISLDGWNYCPNVDKVYATLKKEIKFNKRYVKEKTKRKPSSKMVLEMLEERNLDLKSFDKVYVLGDREEDEGLAKNLDAEFIDAKNNELIKDKLKVLTNESP